MSDDLEQGCARPVQIDATVGLPGNFVVHALAGIFFEMSAQDSHLLGGKSTGADPRSPGSRFARAAGQTG